MQILFVSSQRWLWYCNIISYLFSEIYINILIHFKSLKWALEAAAVEAEAVDSAVAEEALVAEAVEVVDEEALIKVPQKELWKLERCK